jgi:L-malate glycosyltransferase
MRRNRAPVTNPILARHHRAGPQSRPIRVLIVAPSLDIVGGAATQAAMFGRCLQGEPALRVASLATNPQLPGPLRRLQAIKYLRTILTSAIYIAQLLVRVRNHDVIHIFSAAHTSFLISTTPAIVVARAFGKATVVHYHSGEADLHLRRWRRTAVRTIRRVDALVVPSQYLVNQFARHGVSARLITNIFELERYRFREPRPWRPVFLSTRQLEPYCNVGCVLRAFALIQERIRDARLIVAGDGRDREKLETLARELRLTRTEFIGWVDPDQAADMYSAAEIYLNGSDHRDNVPISIVEAFATGLPVVSTDVAGIPEIVRNGETGMLVPADDHRALAASALALVGNRELASTLSRNARNECSLFTWPQVRDQWLALYRDLCSARVDA